MVIQDVWSFIGPTFLMIIGGAQIVLGVAALIKIIFFVPWRWPVSNGLPSPMVSTDGVVKDQS